MPKLSGASLEAQAVFDGDLEVIRRAVEADPEFLRRHIYIGVTAIQLAAGHDDVATIELLTSLGAKVDIHSACLLGRTDIVASLLDERPERIKKKGPKGSPLLHSAAMKGRVDVARLLLDRGAEVSEREPDSERTPMHCAASPDMVRLLLERGADVNVTDRNGLTRLHGAAAAGDAEMVELLLARGADPKLQTTARQTPWSIAVRFRRADSDQDFERVLQLLSGR